MDGLGSTVLQVQSKMFRTEGLGFSFEVQGLRNVYIIPSSGGRTKKQDRFARSECNELMGVWA
jgi:hypothetical protein